MKIFLILALVTMAFGDDGGGIAPPDIEHPSLDYALRQSQQELTWGHEFAEEWLVQNREMLSELLIRIELRVIEDFMDAFTEIQNIAEDTRRRMEEDYPEPSFCKNRIRDRWDLQVVRFGTKMSQCLGIADGYIKQFTHVLNELHDESRLYTNVIPNAGIHTFAGLQIFDARDSLQQYINNRFRDLIFSALDRYREFEEYVRNIEVDVDNLVAGYTECYRQLPIDFRRESNDDLDRIRACYSD